MEDGSPAIWKGTTMGLFRNDKGDAQDHGPWAGRVGRNARTSGVSKGHRGRGGFGPMSGNEARMSGKHRGRNDSGRPGGKPSKWW